jgi:hypothetical protein
VICCAFFDDSATVVLTSSFFIEWRGCCSSARWVSPAISRGILGAKE